MWNGAYWFKSHYFISLMQIDINSYVYWVNGDVKLVNFDLTSNVYIFWSSFFWNSGNSYFLQFRSLLWCLLHCSSTCIKQISVCKIIPCYWCYWGDTQSFLLLKSYDTTMPWFMHRTILTINVGQIYPISILKLIHCYQP